MGNRWHMNRIGFVNFWLYDEESFSFSDGKLLLRGQNGSGKSITTQSFIPFILDGDRSPSRLDPFGSSDRRMEYYFLGESGKEESTGYLFLEFKRENLEQYRTIGIGQRAQKGKPMAFWGFVILDGRRVGYDLKLYREIGTKKIPCTRQELKQVLGEENPCTEVQREYMELVNKHIFGFSDIEQYGQFIKLLIKVRAPKLSKEFKPSKVYEILNDSLQTLSDEDLRAMVEAMEKMDDIQSRLDGLKSAYKELQIIRNEYLRYNLYMLGKKAQAYVDEKKQVDSIRRSLEAKKACMEEQSEELKGRELAVQTLTDEIHILEAEKETLHLEDVEASMDKLEKAKQDQQEAEAEKLTLDGRIAASREQILIYDRELKGCQENVESIFQKIEDLLEELEEENETALFQRHEEVRGITDSRERRRELLGLTQELKKLEREIEAGYSAMEKAAELWKRWNQEEEELQRLSFLKEEAEAECREAERTERECRDELVEDFYLRASENQEMPLAKEELEHLVQLVQNYENPGDMGEIIGFYYQIWMKHSERLQSSRLEIQSEWNRNLEQKNQLLGELQTLMEMPMPAPERKARTEEARRILKERKVSFLPFYEAVDFAEGITQDEKNRIEGQLEAAGLLDALVIPKEERERAEKELQELSDVMISVTGEGGAPYPFLIPSCGENGLSDAVREVLCHLSERRQEGAALVLAPDGYFKNGILEGYCHSVEEASYVGAAAREQKKKNLIEEKRKEIAQAEEILAALEKKLAELELRIRRLNQEKELFPSFSDLNQAMDMLRSCREEEERYRKQTEEQEAVTVRCKEAHKAQEQEVIRLCKPLPYFRTLEAYAQAKSSVRAYEEKLGELDHALTAWETERSNAEHIEELIQKEEEAVDSAWLYLRKAERMVKEASIRIQRLEEYLNNPEIKEMRERMGRIKEELAQKERQYHENDKCLAVLNSQLWTLTEEIRRLQEDAAAAAAKETKLREYFSEELSLKLVMSQESDSVYEAALKAKEQLREADRNRSGAEMTTALMRTFHAHLGALTSYGTAMEECFTGSGEDDGTWLRTRQRIFAIWNGRKLYLEEFFTVIKESIESTELLIQQKDRELFEGILADTLSRKLSGRIRESRNWIRDMSALMKRMDTSMALTFSLEWKPKEAEGENELDTQELEKILARERELLTAEDMDRVSAHFRTKIHNAKRIAEENGEAVNYMDLVREALDYRQWFAFRMDYYRNNENKKELTNGAFNRFSGGEKAMAMYVPLFAAVNAQYKKAGNPDHPRIIALDEAFAGVDDKNISSMFELVQQLDFDYIMNSQVLWGCYEKVKSLRIAELLRPANSNVVTVIGYHWNGVERMLDE